MGSLPPTITIDAVLEKYDAFLLDAYGVLINKAGALPGAVALIEELNKSARPYFILTNSASRLAPTMAEELQQWRLAIPAERIISSGTLLKGYFREHGMAGCPCVVLGPEDSKQYVREAQGTVVELDDVDADNTEAVIIADQKGFDCVEGMNRVLTLILRRLDSGRPVHLLLCNPDLIYPLAVRRYGITAGALAAMIEAVLADRFPGEDYRFTRLGKPHAPLFEEGIQRAGTRNVVMLGDQLATDILGADRAGIDSVLVETGISRQIDIMRYAIAPTYLMAGLSHGLKLGFSC